MNFGTFTMDNGTITSNPSNGGGGGVSNYINGTFIMNGGTISGNTASTGGGVYSVGTYGTFTKTAGTIYGNNEGSNSNTAQTASSPKSHAVYVYNSPTHQYRDTTAGPGDPIKTSDGTGLLP